MYRKLNILLVLLILVSAASAQKKFIIRGQLSKDKSGLIRLTYYSFGKTFMDSLQLKEGSFEFKGLIEAPVQATLEINPIYGRPTYEQRMRQDMRDFYLQEKQTLIKSDSGLKSASIIGGKQQKYFEESEANELSIAEQMWALNDLAAKYNEENNQSGLDSIRKRSMEINRNKDRLDSNFIAGHPDSFVAFEKLKIADVLQKYTDHTVATLFSRFSAEIRGSNEGKIFAEKIKVAKSLKKGMPAPDITLPDPTGKLKSLSSLKGKYVLLCFSPSPDNRNLSNISQKMAGRNFTIYTVTLTNRMEFWNNMRHSESLAWTSVLDLNSIASPTGTLISATAKAYNLTFAMNYCLLLDTNGRILLEKTIMDATLLSKIQKAIK